jgi:hypothetical protein
LLSLRNFVPGHIPIVVKENPKQTGLLRGRLFWQRLAAIPNLVLAQDNVSSLELVKRAELTATITGTAGWEALRFGKPALAFGYVFWSGLPGALRFGHCNWADVENFRFDSAKFAGAAADIGRYVSYGVNDKDYATIVPGFDPAANAAQVARSFREHLDGRGPA